MKQFEDAKNLIKNSREKLDKIIILDNTSLSKKTIEPDLLIEIKNFMENLRSALDFSARGVFIKYGSSSKNNQKIYFPYTKMGDTKQQLVESLEKNMPGVLAKRPNVLAIMETWQPFNGSSNNWLPLFMDLNNKSKHVELTPHVTKQTRGMKISDGKNTIISPKIIIHSGGKFILNGQEVPIGAYDADNLPKVPEPFVSESVVWDSLCFSSNGEKVIPFLKNALERIGPMVENMEAV